MSERLEDYVVESGSPGTGTEDWEQCGQPSAMPTLLGILSFVILFGLIVMEWIT